MAYGYVVEDEFLMEYADLSGLCPEGNDKIKPADKTLRSVMHILRRLRRPHEYCVYISKRGDVRTCFAMGSNATMETAKRARDPKRVALLKEVLGMPAESKPKWYTVFCT